VVITHSNLLGIVTETCCGTTLGECQLDGIGAADAELAGEVQVGGRRTGTNCGREFWFFDN
jgi:hypothetical protein